MRIESAADHAFRHVHAIHVHTVCERKALFSQPVRVIHERSVIDLGRGEERRLVAKADEPYAVRPIAPCAEYLAVALIDLYTRNTEYAPLISYFPAQTRMMVASRVFGVRNTM